MYGSNFYGSDVMYVKFIYSEKATKFCKISTLLLFVCTVDKSKVEISQNFVTFSEYMNFKNKQTKSFQFLLTFRTKIRCLSRRLSALPCNNSHHTFLLQSKTRLRESNIQQDNFHFYIDFSYSDEIRYHMQLWIVLVYYSRDRECHKIPESSKVEIF